MSDDFANDHPPAPAAPKSLSMRRALIVPAVLALVALGACGDSGGDDDATTANSTAKSCDTSGRTVTVDIGDFVFEPTPVDIKRCDSVVWMNTHDQAHTSTGDGSQKWSTGNIAPGETSAEPVQFTDEGTFTYICALHPFMKGTVTVAA